MNVHEINIRYDKNGKYQTTINEDIIALQALALVNKSLQTSQVEMVAELVLAEIERKYTGDKNDPVQQPD